jgi:hypothetical protein
MKRLAALVLLASAQPSVAETDEAGVPIVDKAYEIAGSRLIETAHGPVRITEVLPRDRAEPGSLTVTYLARRDGDIVEKVEYGGVAETNLNGYPGSWSINERLSDWPVIVTETGGTWQGQTCRWITLSELRPTGPFHLTAFQTLWLSDGSVGEPEGVTGKIVAIERNKRFTVRYTGTREFENTYRRGGSGVYVMEGEDGNVLEGC